jgi:uncharacterized protein
MLWGLISAAFLMGLMGGPHCLAMCGSACAGLGQLGGMRLGAFQVGRMLGYAALGAVAGLVVQSVAWSSDHVALLKPVWIVMQAGIMAWGLVLLMFARQPVWMQHASSWVWGRVKSAGGSTGSSLSLGVAWSLLPCGLLYSAVLLAGLSGGMWQGALVMIAFASATVLWLSWLPVAWQRLRQWRQAWGQRMAGLMLVIASGVAIWMNLTQGLKQLC